MTPRVLTTSCRRRARRLGCVLGAGVSLWAQSPRLAADPVPFRVGFAESIFMDINPNDAQAAIKVWAQAVATERLVNLIAVPSVIRGRDTMRTEVRAGRLDCRGAAFGRLRPARTRDRLLPCFRYQCRGADDRDLRRARRRNGAQQRLADLASGRAALLRGPRMALAEPWLERELQALGAPPAGTYFAQLSRVSKLSQAVLPVFFGQIDAAVVTRQGFQTMVELNPQIGKDLRELAVSPGYIPVVLAVRAGFTPAILPEIVASLRNFTPLRPAGRSC
jgi:hypothetical protein